jgi:FtsZ-binding cell division protein ZapB
VVNDLTAAQTEIERLETELAAVREENSGLQNDAAQVEYEGLQAEYNDLQKEYEGLQSEYDDLVAYLDKVAEALDRGYVYHSFMVELVLPAITGDALTEPGTTGRVGVSSRKLGMRTCKKHMMPGRKLLGIGSWQVTYSGRR